jgi:hypothetical protein
MEKGSKNYNISLGFIQLQGCIDLKTATFNLYGDFRFASRSKRCGRYFMFY